jgi:uncharacterized integral membrane protein
MSNLVLALIGATIVGIVLWTILDGRRIEEDNQSTDRLKRELRRHDDEID